MSAGHRQRNRRKAVRLGVGFLLGLLFWIGFCGPYERGIAAVTEWLMRATESPSVTRLSSGAGEILVNRRDFPPGSPRPGLPAADLHFNFVLLVALFALHPKPWEGHRLGALLLAGLLLALVHVVALVFEVRSLYSTRLGPWSAAHYTPLARNFWATGFHFYQIAGRFAAPFAIWWIFRDEEIQGRVSGRASETRSRRKR